MKTVRTLTFALLAGLAGASHAFAGGHRLALTDLEFGSPVITVQADCYAVGQDRAAEMGGTLARATPADEGGTPVCRLVIVVPGAEGERPKRVEITVPQ
jgi:hypothetical protein